MPDRCSESRSSRGRRTVAGRPSPCRRSSWWVRSTGSLACAVWASEPQAPPGQRSARRRSPECEWRQKVRTASGGRHMHLFISVTRAGRFRGVQEPLASLSSFTSPRGRMAKSRPIGLPGPVRADHRGSDRMTRCPPRSSPFGPRRRTGGSLGVGKSRSAAHSGSRCSGSTTTTGAVTTRPARIPHGANAGLVDWDDPRSWHHDEAVRAICELATTGGTVAPVYDIASNSPSGTHVVDLEGQAPVRGRGDLRSGGRPGLPRARRTGGRAVPATAPPRHVLASTRPRSARASQAHRWSCCGGLGADARRWNAGSSPMRRPSGARS